MKVVAWDPPPMNGGGKFHKWKVGRNSIRFLSPPLELKTRFKGQLQTEYLAAVLDLDDGNREKFATLKPAILLALRDFYLENGVAPHASEAPAFCITRSGTGPQTKYSTAPERICPIGTYVNVGKVKAELMQMAKKQEDKALLSSKSTAENEVPSLEL